MRFTLRELVLIGIFGALWGVIEVSLGSVLHAAHVPFKGVILSALGLMLLVVGRMFVPRRGATLTMGVVTALLKLFSIGGTVLLHPIIAIIMEALLAEVVLSLAGQPSRRSALAAGALAISWNFVHPFLTWGILAGQGVLTLWKETIENGARYFRLDPDAVLLVAVILIAMHVVAGLIAGWLGWQLGQRVRARQVVSHDHEASS